MNFNYYRKFDFQLKENKVDKKAEDEGNKKEEELKKEESIKPQTAAPLPKAVTAKADELVENYIKGAMMLPKGGVGNVEEPKGVQEDGWETEVEQLIAQWEGLDDDSYEEKINVLTQIINLYETNGGDEGVANARIWRVRRHSVTLNIVSQECLKALAELPHGELIHEGIEGDMTAFTHFQLNYDSLNDVEKLAYDECNLEAHSYTILRYGLLGNDNDKAHNNAWWLYNDCLNIVNNPINVDKPWQSIFTEYQTKFIEFQQIMEDPNHPVHHLKAKNEYTEELITAVQGKVNELTNLIGELRAQGFPYCDELLISIQGYLVYAGHDDIDVLPYPEGGEGNAKPDSVNPGSVKPSQVVLDRGTLSPQAVIKEEAVQVEGGIKGNAKPEVAQTGEVPPAPKDGGNLQELIDDWNANNETMSYEEKMSLLGQIIDLYEAQGEEGVASARIWRVRRRSVGCKNTQQAVIDYMQRLKNGEPYNPSNVPLFYYDSGDSAAFSYFINNYSSLNLEQKLACDESDAVVHAYLSLIFSIRGLYGGEQNTLTYAVNDAANSFDDIVVTVNNPLNEGADWQGKFAEFQPKFQQFQDIMTNPDHPAHSLEEKPIGGESTSAVQYFVSELQGLIGELRELGFPYCDELLICIQGYLVYAGHNDIDVLPYPEGGEGNAKPEVLQKVKLNNEETVK